MLCSSFLSFDYPTYIEESRKCPMSLSCASPDGVASTDKNCCLSCVLFKFSNMSRSRIQAWSYLCWYKTLTHAFIRRPLICWKFLCAQPCRLRGFAVLFIFFHEIDYSVWHNFIPPSKELCSKMALGDVGVSFPWWYHALVLLAPGYWRLFLNLIIFS